MAGTARRWSVGAGARSTVVRGLAAALVLVCWVSASRADLIVMRGGGQVRGKLMPDPRLADRVLLVLETGKTPLSVEKARIVKVVEEPGPLDGYVVRRSSAPSTAQGQFDLGSYCERNGLPDLAEFHYEAALRLDASFGPAHEKLGHEKVGDRWLSGDQLREAQGLVKYRGRWITREQKEQLEREGMAAAEGASWVRRIEVWREAVRSGAPDRRREAESQLMAVRDPAAIRPLVRTLGGDDDSAIRGLLARVLAGIPGAEADSALAAQLVIEPVADVRGTFLERLISHADCQDAIGTRSGVKTLVQALRSSSTDVVNRAAWALARLNVIEAVPSLISALITTRQRMEWFQPGGMPGMGQGFTAAFGAVPYTNPYAGVPPAPIAYNGSTVAYLLPPAVGPGVVAYGATAVPYYGVAPLPPLYGPSNYGVPAFGAGAGALGGARGPVPRTVTDTFQNTEVLSALVKLTRQDFGYDQDAWRAWLRSAFQPEPKPARAVPQP